MIYCDEAMSYSEEGDSFSADDKLRRYSWRGETAAGWVKPEPERG